jgi:hypothetical protein
LWTTPFPPPNFTFKITFYSINFEPSRSVTGQFPAVPIVPGAAVSGGIAWWPHETALPAGADACR